jgi:hypothetical protein
MARNERDAADKSAGSRRQGPERDFCRHFMRFIFREAFQWAPLIS